MRFGGWTSKEKQETVQEMPVSLQLKEGLEEGDCDCGWSSQCIDLASPGASGGFSVPQSPGRALLRQVQMLRAQTWVSHFPTLLLAGHMSLRCEV